LLSSGPAHAFAGEFDAVGVMCRASIRPPRVGRCHLEGLDLKNEAVIDIY
jgi:hypothetical protein